MYQNSDSSQNKVCQHVCISALVLYQCGRRIVWKSDHQPLEKIRLNFIRCTTKTTKVITKIQPYDFEINYIPGKEFAL